MSKLFSTLKIRGIELKNRLAVSPMCEYSSDDGFANDWHLVHLGSRAVGGAGLVMTEATAITAEGRISPGDLGIWKEEHIDFLSRIAAFIRSQGSVAGIQLAHAGRKASHHVPWEGGKPLMKEEGAWETLAPSAIPYREGNPVPREMSPNDIQDFLSSFANAVRRAVTAGFEVIEIHAAHGYLLNEFLSPLSNKRTDDYGGSFDNRIRLLLETVNVSRTNMPDSMPLFVRISATDWVEGGWAGGDSIELARRLKTVGTDLVDCSSGGNSPLQKIPVEPGYQVRFARDIKAGANILTSAVGLITSHAQAEAILQGDDADMVMLARQFLRDPYFPLHAAKELGIDIEWPKQYLRAK